MSITEDFLCCTKFEFIPPTSAWYVQSRILNTLENLNEQYFIRLYVFSAFHFTYISKILQGKKPHILKLSIFNITEVEVEKVETGSCI